MPSWHWVCFPLPS